VHNDTLIYGGIAGGVGSVYKNIRKYNFKNHVNLGWSLALTDYGEVNYLQLSPDASVLIYGGYYNGEYIKGVSNRLGNQLYLINLSLYWPDGSNTGTVHGLKVVGNKAYAAGKFVHILNNSGTTTRKGFFAFNPLTGAVLSENLNMNGFVTFLDAKDNKLFLSGKFTSINGVSRDQFAVVDTGSMNVGSWQPAPSDPLTAIAFNGQYAFVAGNFKGIYSSQRNGFAAIDTSSHALTSWNPAHMNLRGGKRMVIRGDSLFILGYNSVHGGCILRADTRLMIYSITTGAEYSMGSAPSQNMDDFVIDGNYMYVAYDRQLRRYILPLLSLDASWGTNWANNLNEHSLHYLIADSNYIYAVGDNRYVDACSNFDPKRGYLDLYNKTTGQVYNSFYYSASNVYDAIKFNRAILCNDRMYVQGFFAQLDGNARRNFACFNINTGVMTGWQATFPNTDMSLSYFDYCSDLKLYNGKIWFGSGGQILSDGTQFKGFAAMDTLTGNITSQPLDVNGIVHDFILSDNEITIAGLFDSVNSRPYQNFAVFPLTGIDRTTMCTGGNTSFTSNITGTTYQWQMDTGTGNANITNNSNFTGTASSTLQLNNIPSAWYGYRFRCRVNGTNSDIYEIKFTNTWTGAINNNWENPANWSCASVPDSNTDVIIKNGTIIVNSSTSVRSLLLSTGVNLMVNPLVIFTVLH
jgi:hypothetical protein